MIVAHEQVAPLNDLDSHLTRKVCVFKISRVVRAGRQQRDGRLGHASGSDVLQRFEQLLRVMFHRAHADVLEQAVKRAFHRAPVFQHVTHAARTTAVILQHHVLPLVIAD